MEKAAATGREAGVRWEEKPLAPWAALALAACALSPAVQAQEAQQAPAEVLVAEARAEPPLQVQLRATAIPRLQSPDSGYQAPRVDLSLTPANSRGLGALVGMTGFSPVPPGIGLQPARPMIDLGVRWTGRLQGQNNVDVMAWRRMTAPDDAYSLIQARQPLYGARVEMNLSGRTVKPGFALDRGFVGFQLESGARISIRRKDGRPMIYYRTTF